MKYEASGLIQVGVKSIALTTLEGDNMIKGEVPHHLW